MNNCKNCNQSCNNGDCSCIPQGMTTPNYCPADLPSCPDPSPCNETFDAQCVYYTGVGNECVGLENGQTVEESLEAISTALNPFFCLECINFALPANAATNVPVNQVITWNMVPSATCYDVYLGTSSTTLVLVSLGQILTTYTPPAPLLEGINYYWQVVPRNDAGVPKLACPIFTFTTFKFVCTNPITYITENVSTTVDEFLGRGNIIANCKLCCPTCSFGDGSLYFLGNNEVFSKLWEATFCFFSDQCCININASSETYLKYFEVIQQSEISLNTNCCNNFSKYVQELKDLTDCPTDIIGEGILEYGSLTTNEDSQVHNIVVMFETLYPTATPTQLCDYILDFLKVGLVVYCDENGLAYIGSVESFLKYAESVGLICNIPNPV